MSAPAPTAGWKLPALLRSLARAGWGELGEHEAGVVRVLQALSMHLPDGSAEGAVTQPDLADASGLSVRWVRAMLHKLEDLGVVTVTPGGYMAGRKLPSYVRVNKRRVVALVLDARRRIAERIAERRRTTDERLAARESAGLPFSLPGRRRRHKRTSDLPEVSSGLHPLRGGTGASKASRASRPGNNNNTHDVVSDWKALEVPPTERVVPRVRLRVADSRGTAANLEVKL